MMRVYFLDPLQDYHKTFVVPSFPLPGCGNSFRYPSLYSPLALPSPQTQIDPNPACYVRSGPLAINHVHSRKSKLFPSQQAAESRSRMHSRHREGNERACRCKFPRHPRSGTVPSPYIQV